MSNEAKARILELIAVHPSLAGEGGDGTLVFLGATQLRAIDKTSSWYTSLMLEQSCHRSGGLGRLSEYDIIPFSPHSAIIK
jgi:hypothetical protein